MVFISTSTLYFRYLIGCLYPRYNIRREYNTARCFCQILDLSTGCFCTYSSCIQSVLWLQPQQSKFLSGNNVYNPRGSKYCEAILAKIWTVNTGNEVKMAKLKTWTRFCILWWIIVVFHWQAIFPCHRVHVYNESYSST